MTFKEKLVILRKAKGLTQDEFAAAVGVSRQAVYKWECGQSYPEVPKLLEMKLLFSISIDELLDDNYDIPVPEKKKRKRISKENAEKIEKEVKNTVAMPKVAAAPKATPTPMAAPAAPKVAPIAPMPAAPKAAPAPMAAPAAPKVAPIAPMPAAAPKAAPAPMAAPIIPKAAPAPKIETPSFVYTAPAEEKPVAEEKPIFDEAPKTEKTIFIPTPAQLEDSVAEEAPIVEDDKDEPKKAGLFGRLFGRK